MKKQICIVMDYSDAKIKYFEIEAGLDSEQIEKILYEKLDFNESGIYYMIADTLDISKIEVI